MTLNALSRSEGAIDSFILSGSGRGCRWNGSARARSRDVLRGAMHAPTISPLRYAESACDFYFVCAGSALQSSNHASRFFRCGIHDVKQRPPTRYALRRAGCDYTTIGATRLRRRANSGVCRRYLLGSVTLADRQRAGEENGTSGAHPALYAPPSFQGQALAWRSQGGLLSRDSVSPE